MVSILFIYNFFCSLFVSTIYFFIYFHSSDIFLLLLCSKSLLVVCSHLVFLFLSLSCASLHMERKSIFFQKALFKFHVYATLRFFFFFHIIIVVFVSLFFVSSVLPRTKAHELNMINILQLIEIW